MLLSGSTQQAALFLRGCFQIRPPQPLPTTAPISLDNHKSLFIFLSYFSDHKDKLTIFSLVFFLQGCLWQKEKFLTK